MNPLYPLSEGEARELAGCLLTSSTIERYEQCVRNSQAVGRMLAALKTGTVDGKELFKYGWLYRACILEAPVRSECELPMAVIVTVLARSGIEGVDEMLTALGTSQAPQLAWIAGLSRRLLVTRSGSRIKRTTSGEEHRFESSITYTSSETAPRPREQTVNLSSFKEGRPKLLEAA